MSTRNIMRNLPVILAGGFLLGIVGCQKEEGMTTDNLKTLETEFADPSAEYRTAPLSVWNNKMTESEVERG